MIKLISIANNDAHFSIITKIDKEYTGFLQLI